VKRKEKDGQLSRKEQREDRSSVSILAILWYLRYKMDTTIRNLDEQAYRLLRSRAVLEGKTVGELLNEAIRAYLSSRLQPNRTGSLRDLHPEPYPEGNEGLSREIDAIVYG
jgi:plasmid stability protein